MQTFIYISRYLRYLADEWNAQRSKKQLQRQSKLQQRTKLVLDPAFSPLVLLHDHFLLSLLRLSFVFSITDRLLTIYSSCARSLGCKIQIDHNPVFKIINRIKELKLDGKAVNKIKEIINTTRTYLRGQKALEYSVVSKEDG